MHTRFYSSGGGTMRRVLLLLILCLLPVHGWAATAHVKADQSRVADAGHTTQNASYTGGVTTGNTASGAIWWIPTTSNLTSVTVCGNAAILMDNKTTISTNLAGATFVNDADLATGACTVTATWDANVTDGRMVIVEASGVDTASPVGTTHEGNGQSNPGTGANAITSSAGTPPTPPDDGRILYGFTSSKDGGCVPSIGTDFTMTSVNFQTRSAEYYVQATAASHAATFTGCNDSWVTFLVALKAAGGGGGAAAPKGLLLGVYP